MQELDRMDPNPYPDSRLTDNDMIRRIIYPPVASLKEKDVNNLRCNPNLLSHLFY